MVFKLIRTLDQDLDIVAAVSPQPLAPGFARFFNEHFEPGAGETPDKVAPLAFTKLTDQFGTPFYLARLYSAAELGRRRTRSNRIGKNMEVGEWQALDKIKVTLKMLAGLTGKADDQVGPDCRLGHPPEDAFEALAVVIGLIAPAHLLQQLVLSGLERKMEMRAELLRVCDQVDDLVGQFFRVDRTQPHAPDAASLGDHLQQS